MQFRDIRDLKKFLSLKNVQNIFKWLLMAIILAYIFIKLREENELGANMATALKGIDFIGNAHLFILPLLLVGVNWLVEAHRWQLLSDKIERLNLWQALSGVLAGQSMAFITPQSVGDYLGRIWYMKNSNRYEAVGSVMFGRWSQSLVTGIFGSIGLVFVMIGEFKLKTLPTIILVGLLCAFWLVVVLFFVAKRAMVIRRFEKLLGEKWAQYIKVIHQFNREESVKILLLTMLRYLVFTTQFILIFKLFASITSWDQLLAGITWMFLIKSVVPVINIFADLSVREMAVVYFFTLYPANIAVIIMVSLCLWLINILMPTLIGVFHVYRLKIADK